MKYNKNKLAMIILISVMAISACTQSYSQVPAETPTMIPPDLFVSPFPSVENPMAMIEEFAKGTAAALTTTAGGGTTGTPGTPEVIATTPVVTGTPGTPTNANVVATTPVVVVTLGGPSLTPLPPGVRPTTYTLQKDEFPFCIARRFNVDPADLLSASGLTSPDVYYQGLKLTSPQSGSWPDPSTRALRNHPDTYTVTGNADTTIYGVACKYGDVDPAAIAQNNGISISAALTIGQQLKIP
ncbi:MAG: LysM peptidoglycan-binding domain-containing protein [Anaerolineales bacterium]|nr:LysM peptidoglycan-binding domain-containing protein [Anaerolineales bacterium]